MVHFFLPKTSNHQLSASKVSSQCAVGIFLVDENNLKWVFPSIPNSQAIIDKFCVLSLAYRSGNFITMLAPLRDYLCPRDPKSSPLLCATKECYFIQLSAKVDPDEPGFEETKWIVSEDVNVEHLLDVFTSTDGNSDDV